MTDSVRGTVVVVASDAAEREALRRTLEEAGYRVTEAAAGGREPNGSMPGVILPHRPPAGPAPVAAVPPGSAVPPPGRLPPDAAARQAGLADLSRVALAADGLDEVLGRAAALLAAACGAEFAKVLELLPDGRLRLRAGVGWRPGYVGHATVGPGTRSPAEFALGVAEPVVIEDARTDPRFAPPALLRDHGAVSGLVVVIPGRTRPFGVLGVDATHPRAFAPADAGFLEAVASILAGAVERLRAEADRDRFFTVSVDLLCVAGLDGTFRRVNPSWERVLGFTPAELQADPFLSFVHPDDRDRTAAELGRLAAGADVTGFENRYRCKDGSYRWLQWAATPLPDEGLVYAAARDLTDRKWAEGEVRELNALLERRVADRTAELEAANKELEAFAYSVSHDLRSPLRAVDGFSRILLDDFAAALPADARDHLGAIRGNAQKMGQLIDDLLRFSRLSRQALQTARVRPADVVQEALDLLHAERVGRAVDLTVGDLPACTADRGLLRQVFVNLLGNALKYTRTRAVARIEIDGRADGGERVYWVRDNGAGFDMRYVGKLFGVFQRLHKASEYEGTGVGLAIVQRIVHRHGGRVWAEAEKDKGATFSFSLPAEP